MTMLMDQHTVFDHCPSAGGVGFNMMNLMIRPKNFGLTPLTALLVSIINQFTLK